MIYKTLPEVQVFYMKFKCHLFIYLFMPRGRLTSHSGSYYWPYNVKCNKNGKCPSDSNNMYGVFRTFRVISGGELYRSSEATLQGIRPGGVWYFFLFILHFCVFCFASIRHQYNLFRAWSFAINWYNGLNYWLEQHEIYHRWAIDSMFKQHKISYIDRTS